MPQGSSRNSELRFGPQGWGRFGAAAFLAFWLCGWLVGELLAGGLLVAGLIALLTGRPPWGAAEPLTLGPALGAGAFLLFWLGFWTVGGVAAIRELLRLLWACDQLQLGPATWTLSRRLGPFVKHRVLDTAQIERIYLRAPGSALMAQLPTETVELTSLGTPAARAEAAEQLQARLGLTGQAAVVKPGLPKDWQLVQTPRGERVLTRNLRTRRQQAWVATGLAVVAWGVLVVLLRETLADPSLGAITAMLGAGTLWLTWGTQRLHRSRLEWRIEPGRLVHQRRTSGMVTPLAEIGRLELIESTDSDGDRSYSLRALETESVLSRRDKALRQLTILRELHDPTEPRRLGRWLAEQAVIPFDDRVPTEASRQAEMAHQLERLARRGKLSRRLAHLLARASGVRPPQ